jgi:hypothetical protein
MTQGHFHALGILVKLRHIRPNTQQYRFNQEDKRFVAGFQFLFYTERHSGKRILVLVLTIKTMATKREEDDGGFANEENPNLSTPFALNCLYPAILNLFNSNS